MNDQVVVAGHICLDLFPTFPENAALREFRPGALYHVGAALRSTGGAVANTGLALHRLGIRTALAGKVGDDLFGGDILRIIRLHDDSLAQGMKIASGETTSYTVVISPPGIDRTFLHCPGCNDTFTAADIDPATLAGARLMHFGYPPLMRSIYADGGAEMSRIFQSARRAGAGTSLDMAFPDPASDAGKVDWRAFLQKVLPHVDVFCPSIEELLFMIDRPAWDRLMSKGHVDIAHDITRDLLRRLSADLMHWGCPIVMIKLGAEGAYLRSTNDAVRLRDMGRLSPPDAARWVDQETAQGCFNANVVGTTGSGDCTIAGLLAGLMRGGSLDDALRLAVGVGACSVEAADATSGVPHMDRVLQRLANRWAQRPCGITSA